MAHKSWALVNKYTGEISYRWRHVGGFTFHVLCVYPSRWHARQDKQPDEKVVRIEYVIED